MIEFLPSVVIFLIVVSASTAYFRAMRSAAIRQEVVRNLAFAKIGNAGTLTTPSDQLNRPIPLAGESGNLVSAANNSFQGATPGGCFTIRPAIPVETKEINVPFLGRLTPVVISSSAVVCR